ncbi:MAG TPA: isochorismatase family protein [Acidimicrobiales bacterium]|nr:isochorismatase family protein [Acidimicrobiales bacterium]
MSRSTALIVTDVQRDFCPGGSLAVERGDEVARRITAWVRGHGNLYDVVVATRDEHEAPWHHFTDQPDYLNTWPPHCVIGTVGAELHPDLHCDPDAIFSKGRFRAAYSGFEGTDPEGTYLETWLRRRAVEDVHVVGLTSDFCVAATAWDAIHAGFRTTVLEDLCAGVSPVTTATVRAELAGADVAFTDSESMAGVTRPA